MGCCASHLNDAIRGEDFTFKGYKCKAKIVDVYDGDTCRAVFYMPDARCGAQPIQWKLRMLGYNSPEMRPPRHTPDRANVIARAQQAKDALSALILDKIVIVEMDNFDKYGRILALVRSTEPINVGGVMQHDVLINELMITSNINLPCA